MQIPVQMSVRVRAIPLALYVLGQNTYNGQGLLGSLPNAGSSLTGCGPIILRARARGRDAQTRQGDRHNQKETHQSRQGARSDGREGLDRLDCLERLGAGGPHAVAPDLGLLREQPDPVRSP